LDTTFIDPDGAFSVAEASIITKTAQFEYMNEHLRFISEQVGADRHVVLVLDQAGWHTAKRLKVPSNATLLHLPPYSPELNPVERVWAYLRSHHLSNQVYEDYEQLFAATGQAWNQLSEAQLRSICQTAWLTHENHA